MCTLCSYSCVSFRAALWWLYVAQIEPCDDERKVAGRIEMEALCDYTDLLALAFSLRTPSVCPIYRHPETPAPTGLDSSSNCETSRQVERQVYSFLFYCYW